METKFDLTTDDGRKKALEVFDKYGWLSICTGGVLLPSIWLSRKISSNTITIEEQKNTAIALIKAGQKNNVDEIKITLDQNAGIDIGAGFKGISIQTKIGKSGKMTLEIKYKQSFFKQLFK